MDPPEEEAPLVSGEDQMIRVGKSYTRDVHILSISFLLVFLAYGAAQNLETTVNKDLGTISLGILYVAFMFCSMVASLVIRLMGSKNALVLGTTGYLALCRCESEAIMEGAFAQLKVWQSAAIAVVFFLSPYISLQAMLIMMLVMICVSLLSFLFLAIKVEKVFTRDE